MSAEELKNKGNTAFLNKNYNEAIQFFTEAIKLDPENHVLYSNRSAAYTSVERYSEALQDAEKTVKINPNFAKGFGRLGAAKFGLKKYAEAVAAYKDGLKLDPNNKNLQDGLESAEAKLEDAMDTDFPSGSGAPDNLFSGLFSGDVLTKLRNSPQTAPFCNQPDFLQMIERLRKDPKSFSQYSGDKRIMAALGVLLGVNIQTATPDSFPQQPHHQEEPQSPPPRQEPPKQKEPEIVTPAVEVPQNRKEALEFKEKGTTAYKNRQFPQALEFYTKAHELDPEDITYLTNRSAVYFETQDYENCIADCKSAIEKGREVRADFKLIGRAFQRLGNAYAKLEKYAEAIDAYNRSLTENRTAEVLDSLRKVERLKKEKEERDYLDPELSKAAKEAGNEFFKKQQYPEAIQQYTEAIKRNPQDHTLYSNRSACYTKLGEYPLGLKDADKAIELKPDFTKAFIRKGLCHYYMKEYDKALETYDKGMKIPGEENNAELMEGSQKTVIAIQRQNYGGDNTNKGSVEEQDKAQREEQQRKAKAMSDPEIQAILRDPIMSQVLEDLQTDPKAAQQHLRNPDVMHKINKLIASGILRAG
eukprot:TRINITY_DN13765_c0_g2_i1.p1 TRINITY_DN13765_c0_g2~~TRINITY_DN13765_c0_g2_i1.p1  ORF type:complete len:587 (+),score=176.88 TRINITY_DN13765_c0_g2_i1:191-1951(+)